MEARREVECLKTLESGRSGADVGVRSVREPERIVGDVRWDEGVVAAAFAGGTGAVGRRVGLGDPRDEEPPCAVSGDNTRDYKV